MEGQGHFYALAPGQIFTHVHMEIQTFFSKKLLSHFFTTFST